MRSKPLLSTPHASVNVSLVFCAPGVLELDLLGHGRHVEQHLEARGQLGQVGGQRGQQRVARAQPRPVGRRLAARFHAA